MQKLACVAGAWKEWVQQGTALLRPSLPSACYAGYAKKNIVIISSVFLWFVVG